MSRDWLPCRECGLEHRNPRSSSICPDCGEKESTLRKEAERQERIAYEDSSFGQFMALPEEDRWRQVFEYMDGNKMDVRLTRAQQAVTVTEAEVEAVFADVMAAMRMDHVGRAYDILKDAMEVK